MRVDGGAGNTGAKRDRELLTGVSAAALVLACAFASPVQAGNYTASNDTELRKAIADANADPDPNATITLTGSFAVSNIELPSPTKPVTIDTGSFTLGGQPRFLGTTGTVIFAGTLVGANSTAGLNLGSTTLPSSIVNNGSITGGAGGAGTAGQGATLNVTTFVNNGTLAGGAATTGSGGIGATVNRDSTLTNYGLVQGGSSETGFGGAGIDMGNQPGVVGNTLINHDTIRGGSGGTLGGIGVLVRRGDQPIINTGTIEGGNGALAITSNRVTTSLVVINSGTIRAGSGQGNAITLAPAATTGTLTLELQEGSLIVGNVVANATQATDTLRLGGDADDEFDVSQIGAAQQYRNFDVFEKRGASTWTITGQGSSQDAAWDIREGTMLMSAGSDLGNGAVRLFGGTLAGIGIVGSTTQEADGTIAPGIDGIGTLTIDGDHAGNGGILAIETQLGGDGSPSDLLAITGGTSGTTLVRVTNLGGAGAQTQDGIKIVDVAGDSAGSFNLLGDLVVNGNQAVLGGAYAYSLYQGSLSDPDDGDWYLRSIGFAPSATAYESYPGVLLSLVDMPTMQQRVGNVYMPNAGRRTDGYVNAEPTADMAGEPSPPPANFWTRIEAAAGHYEGQSDTGTEYDLDRYKIQIGIDGRLGESPDGILIAGINAQYGNANADLSSDSGDGDNSTDAYGGGLTLTWLGTSGFYADAQAMVHYLESDLSSDALGDLVDNNEGWGYGLSLELGGKFALDDAISLTPQAQLSYASVDFDDFTDSQGVDVSLDQGESLKGRLGVALGYDSYESADSRGHVYAIANVTYEFLNAQSVDVAGVDLAFEPDEWGGEFGLGGTYEWAQGAYSVRGEALGQTSFEGSYGVKGTAGFSVRF